jgi:PKD repeat protein
VVASVTGLTGSALRSRLLSTADDLGAAGYDTDFGAGRLNLRNALDGTMTGGNDPPPPAPLAASFSFKCSGYDCAFDASASSGSPTSYAWTFGDTGTGSGQKVSHTYPGDGSYTVTLEVSAGGATDSTSDTVTCRKRGPNVRCN